LLALINIPVLSHVYKSNLINIPVLSHEHDGQFKSGTTAWRIWNLPFYYLQAPVSEKISSVYIDS
jgi:hypothetical protein